MAVKGGFMLQNAQSGKFKGVGDRGFTIIEVLIALVILCIGLMAVGILQNRALQYNHSALLRSRAVQSVEDILDKIRANKDNILSYEIGLGDAEGVYETKAELENELNASYQNIVRMDLAEWKWSLSRALPGGRGAVEIEEDADGFLVATITLEWVESINKASDSLPVEMVIPVKVVLAADIP